MLSNVYPKQTEREMALELRQRWRAQRDAEEKLKAARASDDAPIERLILPRGILGVVELLDHAAEHGVNYPTIRVRLADGRRQWGNGVVRRYCWLSLASQKARVPQSVNIEGKNAWYGRILRDAVLELSTLWDEERRSATAVALQTLANDPIAGLAAQGRLSGRCSFCGLNLTDQRSLVTGYGPICAVNFGLPWGNSKPID